MLNYFKTKRLTVLAVLAGFTYAFLLFNTFASDWDNWKISFNERALGAEYNKWGDVIGHHKVESHQLFIKAKEGFSSFPDSIVNLTDNKTLKAKYNDIVVITAPSERKVTTGTSIVLTIVFFLMVFITILIPIHFYKFIGLIKRDLIYDRKNISLLRKLGFELLVIYFGGIIVIALFHKEKSSLFRFSDYEIVSPSMDAIWLMLGIVALMVAEILSKAIVLKEEQELTI